MTVIQSQCYLSPEEYLAQEEQSPVKHEYINGEVYAMAGGSDAHVTIAGNLCALLRSHVRGTGCFDRGDKFADYQHLESLQEYVLISQKRHRVNCYRRHPEGFWALYSFNPGEQLYLASVDFHLDMDALYEDVTLTEAAVEAES